MPVDCRKCAHFKVIWEKDRPYACSAFGFKTSTMPSKQVYIAASKECDLFVQKVFNKR
jgi:hypothetical protein